MGFIYLINSLIFCFSYWIFIPFSDFFFIVSSHFELEKWHTLRTRNRHRVIGKVHHVRGWCRRSKSHPYGPLDPGLIGEDFYVRGLIDRYLETTPLESPPLNSARGWGESARPLPWSKDQPNWVWIFPNVLLVWPSSRLGNYAPN